MITSTTWEVIVSEELDEEHVPNLRVSGSGHCIRRQAYVFIGTEETDPPDEKAKSRMALGKMAEVLIVRDLKSKGWETAHTVLDPGGQLEIIVQIPDTDFNMTGHPDGICRHPDFTSDKWVTLECKSMSPSRAQETQQEGIAKTYPHYMSQIAMYGKILHEMGLVSHPERGVFAIMDREGEHLSPERIKWEPEIYDSAIARMQQIVNEVTPDNMPERPYAPDSIDCRFCSYQTACWGPPAQGQKGKNGPPPKVKIEGDPRVVHAARTWADMQPELDSAKETLQRTCNDHDKVDVESEGVTAGYFIPRENPIYDTGMLQKLIPADILAKCLSRYQPEPKKRFWVRFTKRR